MVWAHVFTAYRNHAPMIVTATVKFGRCCRMIHILARLVPPFFLSHVSNGVSKRRVPKMCFVDDRPTLVHVPVAGRSLKLY
jgi:hypothetical protein